MKEVYFKIIFFVLYFIFTLIRVPHAMRNRTNINIKSKKTKREKFLVFIVSIGMMVLPLTWVFSGLLDKFRISLPDSARHLGAGILIFSLWLFYSVHKTLGKNWSPILEIRENHTLIKDGLYKRIRHPMYAQIWLWLIGQFLFISNWVVGAASLLTWAILYFIRVPEEEKMMEEEFGDEYRQYMKETGRIFPKF